MNNIPQKGDTFTFYHYSTYSVPWQNRPFACRPKCSCGRCDGSPFTIEEEVVQVIHWADHAVEVIGSGGSKEIVAPPSCDLSF